MFVGNVDDKISDEASQKTFYVFLWAVVIIAAIIITSMYFSFVSEHTYEESAHSVAEVYGQVNNNFNTFLKENWNNLEEWDQLISLTDDADSYRFLSARKTLWNIDHFYYFNENEWVNLDGKRGTFAFEGDEPVKEMLFSQGEHVMFNETLPDGTEETIFAIPASPARWNGVDYTAIGIGFSHDSMVEALTTDAFGGNATTYIVRANGVVFMSTNGNDASGTNMLNTLLTDSDMTQQSISEFGNELEGTGRGVFRCSLNGVPYYVSYGAISYLDYNMVGFVPESATSASMSKIQSATIEAIVKIALLLCSALIIQLIFGYRKKLRQSNIRTEYRNMMFEILSESDDDIMIMIDDATKKIDYATPNAKRLLGASLEDMQYRADHLNEPPLDKTLILTQDVLDEIRLEEHVILERTRQNKDTGETRYYKDTIYHVNAYGKKKYVIVMSDRTNETKIQESLKTALSAATTANNAKTIFLSNMSHDMRTPMNAILGFLDVIDANAHDIQQVKECAHKIKTAGEHLLRLINDVLDMSKIESGTASISYDDIDLPSFLEELSSLITPQIKAKEQTFELNVSGCVVSTIIGDKLKLTQILTNLLGNAVKYTQRGGHVVLTVKEMREQMSGKASLRFIVQDDGCGISEAFIEHVFEPFVHTDKKGDDDIQGTGLGLAITKSLVELMGGRILIYSVEGKGTTFTVDLTFATPDGAYDKLFWKEHDINRILLIEPDEPAGKNIKRTMGKLGVEVDHAMSEEDGLAMIDIRESDGGYDCVIMEWEMDTYKRQRFEKNIRQRIRNDAPLIVMRAYNVNNESQQTEDMRMIGYMTKPFFANSLKLALSSFYDDEHEPTNNISDENESDDPLNGLNILAAEDNEINAEILCALMEMKGANVEVFEDGQKAYEAFISSDDGAYDLIFMDIRMPVMNGYEATKAIRSSSHTQAKNIPILAMTANVFEEDIQASLDAGMDAHLAKPIDIKTISEVVAKILEEKKSER